MIKFLNLCLGFSMIVFLFGMSVSINTPDVKAVIETPCSQYGLYAVLLEVSRINQTVVSPSVPKQYDLPAARRKAQEALYPLIKENKRLNCGEDESRIVRRVFGEKPIDPVIQTYLAQIAKN